MRYMLCIPLCIFIGCEVLESDLSHEKVQIISPEEYAMVKPGQIEFCWQHVIGASNYRFIIMHRDFDTKIIIMDSIIQADTLALHLYRIHTELEDGQYQWSICAFNSESVSHTATRTLVVQSYE